MMDVDGGQLSLDLQEVPQHSFVDRCEEREEIVRVMEYTHFPRLTHDPLPRIGFTRDVSASGACIGVDSAEPVDALLRVVLRDVDGKAVRLAVARVAWTRRNHDGRYWLGLELVSKRELAAAA